MLCFFLFFIFQKTLFKVKALKTFRIFSDYHMKICQSLKQKTVLKVHIYVLPRNYVLSAGFKMEPLWESAFRCLNKNQLTFCSKIFFCSKINCLFFVYLIESPSLTLFRLGLFSALKSFGGKSLPPNENFVVLVLTPWNLERSYLSMWRFKKC